MLNKKKVAGILCENKTPDTNGGYSVVLLGIGLNVNMEQSVCESLDQPATSLSIEAKGRFDKERILPLLYQESRKCIDRLLGHGFSDFFEELKSMMAFQGETVIVDRDDKGPVEGVFIGIDEMGRMKLRRADTQIILLQDGRIRKKFSFSSSSPNHRRLLASSAHRGLSISPNSQWDWSEECEQVFRQ